MARVISKKGPFRRERWLKETLASKKRFSFMKPFLSLLSYYYKLYIFLRNGAYDIGLFPQSRSCLPVVSIGSITCGGTRKTPLTAHIAEKINRPVGILTSGYAAKMQHCEKNVSIAAQGDEAYLLSLKVPFAKVYANKKRIKSVKCAERENLDYLLMDSGLQHRALYRDIEIITVNAKNLFSGGNYLPRGFLRDLPSRLKNADWVVIMDCESENEFTKTCLELKKINKKGGFIGMNASLKKPEMVRQKKIGVFCGIAQPESFIEMLKKEKCDIVSTLILSDHEPFEQASEFVEKSKKMGAEFVVCTEKDFVKLLPADCEGILPLELNLEVKYGNFEYKKMMTAIDAKCES